jgi:Ca2+-binding EF-hand superfamily protein
MTRLTAKEHIMVASISSSTVSNWSESLFNKLDTKKQGYVDQSDLAAALGTDETGATDNADDAAAILKQIDGDDDGKITQSELSTAISKVADELNAQFDSSRVDKSQAGATGMANVDEAGTEEEDATAVAATGATSTASATRAAPAAGGGAAPAAAASSTESTNKYVQAADTDSSGEVSDDEAAAYKKLMAKQAEAQSGPKPGAPADGDDKDLARALDQLKQYVENSGAAGGATASSTVDTSA